MNIKTKIIKYALPFFTGALILSGCSHEGGETQTETIQSVSASSEAAKTDPATASFFAMDTVMELTAYGDNGQAAVTEGEELVGNIEKQLSTEIEESAVSKLNKNKSAVFEDDTRHLMETALATGDMTNGAFNISIYPLMKEWGFISQEYKVPDSETIKELLSNTDLSEIKINTDTNEIALENKDMEIDLGGIAKGYTSDSLINLFKEKGIKSGMVNLGGNVQLLGTKPNGSLWRVGIRSPYEDVDFLGILSASDVAVITSGGYERYFEQDGNIYHHIMDPATGFPADNGLVSVTVVSKDATLADALSTALYVMGKDKAIDFWRKHTDSFDMILMDNNDELYISEGIYDSFSSDTFAAHKITK